MDPGQELVAGARAARGEGQFVPAATLYTRAAGYAREHGDMLGYAHRLRHAADLYCEAGSDSDAASLYAEALAVYRRDPATPTLDLANLLRPFALLKEKAGDRVEAAALWTEAKRHYEAADVEAGVLESERALARLA